MDNVERFKQWWESLTPEQKRERRLQMVRFHAWWMQQRRAMLFGVLESADEEEQG